jgi:hypothetical protein
MAKVKIQGNASGTGVITLTAPNTSTDRTVTLPDADVTLGVDATKLPLAGGTVTGQIAIDQNSNARALTIDSESTSETGIVIDASVLTTGRAAHFYSNAPSSSTRDLVHVENVHASSTGTTAFKVTQNSTGLAADFIGDKIRAREGILFGTDTAAANALDDYEEGTWTPVWTPDGGTIVTNTTYTGGLYTKVGNLVTIHCRLYTNSVSSPTGKITISGLPYAIKNSPYTTPYVLWSLLGLNGSLAGMPIAKALGNTTTLQLSDWAWGTTESGSNIADKFDADVWCHAGLTYMTN